MPTETLYLTGALDALSAQSGVVIRRLDARPGRLEQFQRMRPDQRDTVVVVRYLPAAWLAALHGLQHRPRCVYLIDDDLPAASATAGLPSSYRRRMFEAASFDFDLMLSCCDRLVITSPGLAARYASPKTLLLEPSFVRPPRDISHHTGQGPVRIAYHATASHHEDARFVLPVLHKLVEEYAQVELDIVMADAFSELTAHHPRVRIQKQMPWEVYCRHALENPAHIAIVPLLPSPYNQGRSAVKFLDVASLGAAGIFSNVSPYTTWVRHGQNGLLADNRPAAWEAALRRLVEDPRLVHALARQALADATVRGDVDRARDFWRRVVAGAE